MENAPVKKKRPYVRPFIVIEQFMPVEYISICSDASVTLNCIHGSGSVSIRSDWDGESYPITTVDGGQLYPNAGCGIAYKGTISNGHNFGAIHPRADGEYNMHGGQNGDPNLTNEEGLLYCSTFGSDQHHHLTSFTVSNHS